jgi:hypothetical protein
MFCVLSIAYERSYLYLYDTFNKFFKVEAMGVVINIEIFMKYPNGPT